MGRDTSLYVFIGRKCTNEEKSKIQILTEDDPDYYDSAHILELNPENPFMEIDGYPVVLISNKNGDGWYICEKFINCFDLEHQDKPIELDHSDFITNSNNNKLLLVAEISY